MGSPRVAFTIHKCLGEGGHGEVYLATQTTEGGIHREVAVKLLHERFDESSDAMKRLRDEGQALALLAHPNIVQAHGFTKIDGRLALVAEYAEGEDLSQFCTPDTRLPPRVAAEVARDVAEALVHALEVLNPHTGNPLGMIHRDIKPANIRITTDGNVKLLDFGVARSDDMKRQAQTAMGDVLLTSGFAAPEALSFGVSEPSVDVFALGVTLFAMATGKQFYKGRDLKFQVTLAMDDRAFLPYLDERLLLVEEPAMREVIRGMLKHDWRTRWSASVAAEHLHQLSESLEGPKLGTWARRREWPPTLEIEGDLVGLEIDVDGHVINAPKEAKQAKQTIWEPNLPPKVPEVIPTPPPPPPRPLPSLVMDIDPSDNGPAFGDAEPKGSWLPWLVAGFVLFMLFMVLALVSTVVLGLVVMRAG